MIKQDKKKRMMDEIRIKGEKNNRITRISRIRQDKKKIGLK